MNKLEYGHVACLFKTLSDFEGDNVVAPDKNKGPLIPALILTLSPRNSRVPSGLRLSSEKYRNHKTDSRPMTSRPMTSPINPVKEMLKIGQYLVYPESLSLSSRCESLSESDIVVDQENQVHINIGTIFPIQPEFRCDFDNQIKISANTKRWPENFVKAMLKMQCDVTGADYALRWRYVQGIKGMIVVDFYIPPDKETQTEGETGTRAFVVANIAMTIDPSNNGAVWRTYQSHETILIDVSTCVFFVRAPMAIFHGIKSICFRQDSQGDIIEFGSQDPDWKYKNA